MKTRAKRRRSRPATKRPARARERRSKAKRVRKPSLPKADAPKLDPEVIEAWALRRREREEFLEKLKERLYGAENKINKGPADPECCASIRLGIAGCALDAVGTWLIGQEFTLITTQVTTTSAFFEERILPSVRRFSRAPEEMADLLRQFALMMIEEGGDHVEGMLGDAEHRNPKRIYHAATAQERVEVSAA